MSNIKLLRSFVKIILSYDKDVFTSNMGNNYLQIKSYNHSLGYAFLIVSPNCTYSSFLGYSNHDLKFDISISGKTIRVVDFNEFLDSDDISLVLKYGRNVLDENIIDLFNHYHSSVNVSLSDFDTFFIRMGLK